MVVLRHRSFALIHLDENGRLVVHACRKCLGLLCRNRCVPWNQGGEYPAHCFDTLGEGGHIQNDYIVQRVISCQDAALDCSTVCYCFVRVHRSRWLFSVKELRNQGSDARNPC
mmetsp:Transcript_3712/g.8341  ORF Transcript_3712/g.8341 Transcript_3712/m.8341 type:complete len:113 (-) Transcript_3712:1997-2335(-)